MQVCYYYSMEEIITLNEWNKNKDYYPIILSEAHLEIFKDQISEEKKKALRNNSVVFIEGFWCILSRLFKTTTIK